MKTRTQFQLAEALGDLNRWYCSQSLGRQVDDEDLLLTYYIKSGGAADFAKRYDHAMGPQNRWFCSEFYRREIADPQILWEYYMKFAPTGAVGKEARRDPPDNQAGLHLAC